VRRDRSLMRMEVHAALHESTAAVLAQMGALEGPGVPDKPEDAAKPPALTGKGAQ